MIAVVRSARVRTLTRAAAALVAACLFLGCSGGGTRSPSPRVTGSGTFSSAHFSVSVPSGWRDQTHNRTEVSRFAQNGTVLLLFEAPPPGQPRPNVNDVTANINVVLANSPVPDDQLAAYLTSVRDSGASGISQPQPFSLDGQTGLYVTYESNVSGTPGKSQDMVVNYQSETYDIVLNTSKYAFTAQLPALMLMLDSWTWKS